MNKYFTIRIKLQSLGGNSKQEYRDLYSQLRDVSITDTFFDEFNNEMQLPEGVYSILSFQDTGKSVLRKAEEAIEKALKPYYPSNWSAKYTIIVSGPSIIYSKNLDEAK
jgi:hypothetical protein